VGWATVGDVLAIASRTVDADTVTRAQSMVETVVDRYSPDDDAGISARDLLRLKRAVVWQAAWLATNPVVDGRGLVSSTTQDGVSVQFASKDAVVLAPMAKRAIRNLQFRRRNTVRMVSDFEAEFGMFTPPDFADDVDWDDDDFVWTPLGGVVG